MVGLTFTPPLLPSLAAAPSGTQAASSAAVAVILSARAPQALQNSLADTLLSILGPGSIVTGKVTTLSSDGTATLTTDNGSEISIRYPPIQPLALGSTVTLRIVASGATQTATLLAVDGRPVVVRPGTAPPATPPAAATPSAPSGAALPGADSASAYAASLSASLSLEDEAVIERAIDPTRNTGGDDDSVTLLDQVLAILVRPAAVRMGQVPLPLGTRYIASLEVDAASLPAEPEDEPVEAPRPAPLSVSEAEEAGFEPQSAVIAGRVAAPVNEGETLVETALGTLALPASLVLTPGMAVRLTILAVAPPLTSPAIGPATQSSGLIDQIIRLLTGAAPELAEQAGETMSLPPGPALLTAAWRFIADPTRRAQNRALLPVIKQALIDADRPDLADRFESAAGDIGRQEPAQDGWSVLTLPFFGLAGEQPLKLYTKGTDPDGEQADDTPRNGERIVVEIALTRLGTLQFDGLVRERRFDLVVRSAAALDDSLRSVIDRAFSAAISECGFQGDLLFARTQQIPFLATKTLGPGVGISV